MLVDQTNSEEAIEQETVWHKEAVVFLSQIDQMKVLLEKQKQVLRTYLTTFIMESKIDLLTMALAKFKKIKKENLSLFTQNYQYILNQGFLDSTRMQKNEYCHIFLDLELIDIWENNLWASNCNFVIAASACGNPQMLSYLMEKGVSFVQKTTRNENILHALGRSNYEQSLNIECLTYLFQHSEMFKSHLNESNYAMLFEKDNYKNWEPLIHFLEYQNSTLAQSLLDKIEDFEVLAKIQCQLNRHFHEHHPEDHCQHVIDRLNEKMITHERDKFNFLEPTNHLKSSGQSRHHKI